MEKYFLIIIWGTIFMVLLIAISIIFLLQYQKKHKKFIDQKNNFTQTLLQSQLEIQEQTLKNISQEIHDNIGQVLSLVKLNLFTMDVSDNESILIKIDNSKELVSKAITDLRDLSHGLNTDYIEEKGLVQAILYELEMINKTGILKTVFEVSGEPYRFQQHKELIVFRIIQEALHNVIKHGFAQTIHIKAEFQNNFLNLLIIDDGIGFDLGRSNEGNSLSGIGIKNMHQRARLIGINFDVDSKKGFGTKIKLEVHKD